MSNQIPRPRILGLLAFVAALTLSAATCGSDDEVLEDTDLPVQNDEGDDEAAGDEGDADDEAADDEAADPENVTPGYTRLTPRSDLVSLEPGIVQEIIVDPENDQHLLLHFQGPAEPCSGAAVAVEETATSVIIDLQIGLDPDAAAMSCIAQVFDYEVDLTLDAPLSDRTINVVG